MRSARGGSFGRISVESSYCSEAWDGRSRCLPTAEEGGDEDGEKPPGAGGIVASRGAALLEVADVLFIGDEAVAVVVDTIAQLRVAREEPRIGVVAVLGVRAAVAIVVADFARVPVNIVLDAVAVLVGGVEVTHFDRSGVDLRVVVVAVPVDVLAVILVGGAADAIAVEVFTAWAPTVAIAVVGGSCGALNVCLGDGGDGSGDSFRRAGSRSGHDDGEPQKQGNPDGRQVLSHGLLLGHAARFFTLF